MAKAAPSVGREPCVKMVDERPFDILRVLVYAYVRTPLPRSIFGQQNLSIDRDKTKLRTFPIGGINF